MVAMIRELLLSRNTSHRRLMCRTQEVVVRYEIEGWLMSFDGWRVHRTDLFRSRLTAFSPTTSRLSEVSLRNILKLRAQDKGKRADGNYA